MAQDDSQYMQFNAGSTVGNAPIFTTNQGAYSVPLNAPAVTVPQREIDKAMETLVSAIQGLAEDVTNLQCRLSPVLSLRPQVAEKQTGIPPSSYTCALASSLETKTNNLNTLRQMVNGMLSDLQL